MFGAMSPYILLVFVGLAGALPQQIDQETIDAIFGKPKDETTTQAGAPNFMGSSGMGVGGCVCVPYYDCDENKVIRLDGETNGFGVIDIRFGTKCKHYLELCCTYPPDYTGPPITPSTTPNPDDPITPSTQVIPTVKPTTPPPTLPPQEQVRCGQRNPRGLEFSITGNNDREAEYAEFPWMVAVLRRNWVPGSKDTFAVCGGSLIHPQVVLTGAHCIENTKGLHIHESDIKIRAGEWDTQTERERYPYQESNVKRIIKHPGFHNQILKNDIALLVLEQPVNFAPNVKPVCLPEQQQRFDQKECYASGWGKTKFGKEGTPSVLLKKIDLPMVQHGTCEKLLKKTRLGHHFILDPSFTCAGGIAGKDACTGDGGGPLVCPEKNNPERYSQAGIVAWGVGCGDDNVPGVYTNVAMFRNWIDSQMQQLNFDTSSYTV